MYRDDCIWVLVCVCVYHWACSVAQNVVCWTMYCFNTITWMAYNPDFCAARINGFPGNSVGLIHCVANIRTSNHRFHVDSWAVWVAGSATSKKNKKKFYFLEWNHAKKWGICLVLDCSSNRFHFQNTDFCCWVTNDYYFNANIYSIDPLVHLKGTSTYEINYSAIIAMEYVKL